MPNRKNIESPITLIAPGRSGTSLLSNVFSRHPQCASLNETIHLIFGTWQALEFSTGVPPLREEGQNVPRDARAGRLVREAFLTTFPGEEAEWFHKPIGVPRAFDLKFADGIQNEQTWPEAAEWYWKVMNSCFPKARIFTILRHPCDIMVSAHARWGACDHWWQIIGFMAFLLQHPESRLDHAIHFEELVRHYDEVLQRLFDHLGIEFDSSVLDALSQVYVPTPGRETPGQYLGSRRDEWSQLDPSRVSPACVDAVTSLFNRFGYELDLPPTLDGSRYRPMRLAPDEELHRTIAELRNKIDMMHRERAITRRGPIGRLLQRFRNLLARVARGSVESVDR